MDILRPAVFQVRRAGQQSIVVAGRDKNGAAAGRQRGPERLERVTVDTGAVKQVARQQHGRAALGQRGQPLEHEPLLGAALDGLLRRQGRKGGIKMQIRRMQQLNHGYPPS